jgi:hypothetical protein
LERELRGSFAISDDLEPQARGDWLRVWTEEKKLFEVSWSDKKTPMQLVERHKLDYRRRERSLDKLWSLEWRRES